MYLVSRARILGATALVLLGAAYLRPALANEGHAHDTDLHFAHPLAGESPSPDSKLRLDYFYEDRPGELHGGELEGGGQAHTLRLEGEYAFSRSLSVEFDLPYTSLDADKGGTSSHLDTIEIALKYANFTFAKYGLLIGGGLELGLPSGSERNGIGSNNVIEIEPFLDFGYKRGHFETVGFVSFGVPVNEKGEDEVDLELGWSLSFLYHAAPRVQLIVEFDGEHAFGGEEDGESVINIRSGVKFQPFADPNLMVGAGLGFPLTSDKGFKVSGIVSVFYHF